MVDYAENIFLLFNYQMNKLHYRVKRLTAILTIMGIILMLVIPLGIIIGINVVNSQELWIVKEKHEMGREYLNRSNYAPYHITVEREHILLWIEVDWDVYLNIDVGDRIRLNPNCDEIIGVIK